MYVCAFVRVRGRVGVRVCMFARVFVVLVPLFVYGRGDGFVCVCTCGWMGEWLVCVRWVDWLYSGGARWVS